MAEIVLNDATKTVGAVMTDQEYAIVKPAIEAPGGKEGLQRMFASFLEAQRQQQAEAERAAIKAFAETAPDGKRAEVMAIINRRD